VSEKCHTQKLESIGGPGENEREWDLAISKQVSNRGLFGRHQRGGIVSLAKQECPPCEGEREKKKRTRGGEKDRKLEFF